MVNEERDFKQFGYFYIFVSFKEKNKEEGTGRVPVRAVGSQQVRAVTQLGSAQQKKQKRPTDIVLLNLRNSKGRTPLHMATCSGKVPLFPPPPQVIVTTNSLIVYLQSTMGRAWMKCRGWRQ